jgi:hypothetical protein
MEVVAMMASTRHLQLKKNVSNDEENKSVRETERGICLEVEEGKETRVDKSQEE